MVDNKIIRVEKLIMTCYFKIIDKKLTMFILSIPTKYSTFSF